MTAQAVVAPEPVRPLRLLRPYASLLWRNWLVIAAVFIACPSFLMGMPVDTQGRQIGVEYAQAICALMLVFPLTQAHGQGRRRSLDEGVPVGHRADTLARLAAGTAVAAALLAVCVSAVLLITVPKGLPWWYGASWMTSGLTLYLLGWACHVRARHPGGVLWTVLLSATFTGVWVLGPLRPMMLPFLSLASAYHIRAQTWAASFVWLGAAALVVCGAIHLEPGPDYRISRYERMGARVDEALRRAWSKLPRRARKAPARAYRPVSRARVGMYEVRAMWGRVSWPIAITAVLAGVIAAIEMRVTNRIWLPAQIGFSNLLYLSLGWPMLVWMGFSRRPAALDASAPVGRLAWLLLRTTAGGVWLLLAVSIYLWGHVAGAIRAGTLPLLPDLARIMAGVLAATLLLYLFGSALALASRYPAPAIIMGFIVPGIVAASLIKVFPDLVQYLPPVPAVDVLLGYAAWKRIEIVLAYIPLFAWVLWAAAWWRAHLERRGPLVDLIGNKKLTEQRLASLPWPERAGCCASPLRM